MKLAFHLSLSLSLSLNLSLTSCDIIEAPYLDNPNSQKAADELCLEAAQEEDPFGPGTPVIVKKVLFEEMTGHQCGNCPEATEKLAELEGGSMGDRIVTVGIHAGPLAQVMPSGKYSTDFRTGPGNELYSSLNILDAVPFGLIDRVEFGLGASTWESKVQLRLQAPAGVGIRIFNCYDADDHSLQTVIDIKYLMDASSEEYLSVYLVEDSIVDWQKDYRMSAPDIQNYVHQHVFRAAITGLWGEPLTSGGMAVKKGDRFTHSYSFSLSPDFVPAHCKVVAFVSRADTDEVWQAEEAPVIE